jgi:hypothetical protein
VNLVGEGMPLECSLTVNSRETRACRLRSYFERVALLRATARFDLRVVVAELDDTADAHLTSESLWPRVPVA